MINEAVIVAGGKGTRLKSVIDNIPKPMAPVGNRPFLEILLDQLIRANVNRVVLSVGYHWEKIKDYFGESYKGITLIYAIEETPLGTGGGIKNASRFINGNRFFVLNGDSYFDIDLNKLFNYHEEKNADISICLKEMKQFNRYGSVVINNLQQIIEFKEKQFVEKGYINGGVYVLNKNVLSTINSINFSFEKDILENKIKDLKIFGIPFESYFIDIGIPEDYQKAILRFTKDQ